MYLIDVYLTLRRITRCRMQAASPESSIKHRSLLVSISINIPEDQGDKIEANACLLTQYGLVLDRNSPGSVIVRTIPLIYARYRYTCSCFHDIASICTNNTHEQSSRKEVITVFE